MKIHAFILYLFLINTASANTDELLIPGIYRLNAPSQRPIQNLGKADTKIIKSTKNFSNALPKAAKISYAMVSRDDVSHTNKIVFLVDENYRDSSSADNLCVAYAFPNWNSHSESQPFCTNGNPIFRTEKSAFSIERAADERMIREEKIPPQRAPTDKEKIACILISCSGEAYGYSIYHYATTLYHDDFSLQAVKNYQDIFYLTKDLSIYHQSSKSSAHTNVGKGKFVAITAMHPDWYEVDSVKQDGEILHGWLSREDLIEGEWVGQKAKLPKYRFRVALQTQDESDSEAKTAVAIEVINRMTNRRVQMIYDFYSDPNRFSRPEEMLSVVDANFDGYPDIMVFGSSGGAGPNSTENIFLFDPKTQKFALDEMLSGLPQLDINSKNRTISSASRSSCCSHHAETYRYIKGKLTLVADWDESMTVDGEGMVTTTGKLMRGKMIYRAKRRKLEMQ
ncbi:XAC2610-related protein [Paraherbaspirillum soli]|uniref:XAC2610-related protein n=1 Tax=Paraherbaspirillum soli TaxID=631222 RepID=A0ABW0M7J1_9BURK